MPGTVTILEQHGYLCCIELVAGQHTEVWRIRILFFWASAEAEMIANIIVWSS